MHSELCGCCHCLIPELVHCHPKETMPIKQTSLAPDSTSPLSVSRDLPFLDVSCQQNHHMVCGCYWLLSPSIVFSAFICLVTCVSVHHSFLPKNNIPSYGWTTSCSFIHRCVFGWFPHFWCYKDRCRERLCTDVGVNMCLHLSRVEPWGGNAASGGNSCV